MKKTKNNFSIEIVLVGFIVICMLLLIHISMYKLHEVVLNNNTSMNEGVDTTHHVNNALAREIIKHNINTDTRIEIYDKDFISIFKIPANSKIIESNITDIKQFESLKSLLINNNEGHTRIYSDDYEHDVYFRWAETENSEKRLIFIYTTRNITKNLWLIPFLCYVILFLIFILIIRLHIARQEDRIENYYRVSIKVRDKLFNRH